MSITCGGEHAVVCGQEQSHVVVVRGGEERVERRWCGGRGCLSRGSARSSRGRAKRLRGDCCSRPLCRDSISRGELSRSRG